jgi:hypothetical protein
MRSPGPPVQRSFIAGMLASALSITLRLKRHNWCRGTVRPNGSRPHRYAQRKLSGDEAATPGNPIILSSLLILLALLANREMSPFSSLGCVGMYSVIRTQSNPSAQACYAASGHGINSITAALEEKLELIPKELSNRDPDDVEELLFDDIFDPPSGDLF